MSISRLFPEAADNPEILGRLQSLSDSFSDSNDDLFAKWEAFALKNNDDVKVTDAASLNAFQSHLEKTVRTVQSKKPRLMPRQLNGGALPSIFRQDIKAEPLSDPRGASARVVRKFNDNVSASVASQPSARAFFNLNTSIDEFRKERPFNAQVRASSTELDNEIERIVEAVASSFNLSRSDFMNPSQISQNVVWAVGRITREAPQAKSIEEAEQYWENSPKLEPKLMLLEASRRIGGGSRTQLDFSLIPETRLEDLFEGQILVVKGKNPKGDVFVVHEIIDIPRLPLADLQSSKRGDGPVRIAVAAAPSTPDLLENLLMWASHSSLPVSALVVLGPLLASDAPFEDRQRVRDVVQKINKHVQIPVVLMPAPTDALITDPLFPQPPYTDSGVAVNQPILRVSNPCTFSIDEIAVSAAAVSTLRDTQLNSAKQSFKHVLRQRRLYPVYPPPAGVSVDVPNLKLANIGSVAPNVLVLPSASGETEYHVVDGVICLAVNPLDEEFVVLNVASRSTPLESRVGIDVMQLN